MNLRTTLGELAADTAGRLVKARAAAAFGFSQPTLSAGIRRLEEEVGFPVVRRERRYEGLTPEGERVHEWALRILADLDGLSGEVGALHGALRGRVRIGAVPTAPPAPAAAISSDQTASWT